MQLTENTSGMPADLSIFVDKEGRDRCVVAVKGTFDVGRDGRARLAARQIPLVYADEHHGSPASTSVRYESDFSPPKPLTDVLVSGSAFAPGGRPVRQMTVRLESRWIAKDVLVTGERHWESRILGIRQSTPEPFLELPLRWERSFGGSDYSHQSPRFHGAELRNPVGVGFHLNHATASIEGRPLPNLEAPRNPMVRWNDKPTPCGVGFVGRGWQPRIAYAGTYDDRWLENRAPFLPGDFDPRYFQAAPEDQQIPHPKAGETFVCHGMTRDGFFKAILPDVKVPVRFRFVDHDVRKQAQLDTILLEPGDMRMQLVWHAEVLLPKKLVALREIEVGERRSGRHSSDGTPEPRNGMHCCN